MIVLFKHITMAVVGISFTEIVGQSMLLQDIRFSWVIIGHSYFISMKTPILLD
jgi:hypothetical protein